MSNSYKIIINTSAISEDNTLSVALKQKGVEVIDFPMIEIVSLSYSYLKANVNNLKKFNYVIFTSKHGVKYFFDYIIDKLPDVYKKMNSKFIVIGKRTAKELEKYSFKAFYISENGNAKGMLQEFIEKNFFQSNDNVLLVLGCLAPDTLEDYLKNVCKVKRINVYNTMPINNYSKEIFDKIISGSYNLITFASPSAVYNFAKIMRGKINFNVIHAAAIGKTTGKAMLDSDIKPLLTASYPDAENFADEIANILYK